MAFSHVNISLLDFDDSIQRNLSALKEKYEKYFPSESFSSVTDTDSYFQEPLTDSAISDMMDVFSKSPTSYKSTPFLISYLLSKAAIRLRINGKIDQAWFLLSEARYFAGVADASLFGTEKFTYEVVNSHSIKGWESRSGRFSLAKKEAARLILETAAKFRAESAQKWPGWKCRQEAADAISDSLRDFVRRSNISLTLSGISHRVYVWMRDDADIRNAFNETCAEDARYTPKRRKNWDVGCALDE